MSPGIAPRPHQVEALADLMRGFAVRDRVQLVMACGTGKTLIGRWHAEASEARRVLVLVPSLALLAQTLAEWRRIRSWPFEALVVCSDPTTSAGAAERSTVEDGDIDETHWARVRAKVTTNPAVAASFMRKARDDRPQVIFSTYHSAPVVAAAQQLHPAAVFDLAICDEAHRLAGSPRDEFRAILEPRRIVARRRLFMTATPRNATGTDSFSMDDPKTFGVVAHNVSFGDAIAEGLLTDYQVLVVAGHAPATRDPDDPTTLPAAMYDAIDQHDVRRILSFHGRVAKAAAFAGTMHNAATPAGRQIAARHVSGAMPTDRRTAAMEWLGDSTEPEVRIVSNARVLSEGIDVPAVDGICFADQRSSVVDIIQAIGRVLRPARGKLIGTIIVPVTIAAGVDDDTELLLSDFGVLWTVLRGLRAHDQRFARELDSATRARVRHGTGGYRPARIHFVLPDDIDEDQLHLRLVQEVGDAWERFYGATEDWAWQNNGKRLPRNTRWKEAGIGEWAVKQRIAHARGVLPPERARRLEQLPGWFWDREDAAWADTYSILEAFSDAHGTIADDPTPPSRFDGLRAAAPLREKLGIWLAIQRQAYRDGTLDPIRAADLEQLNGWTWTPVPAEDLAMVDALRQFCEFEKHADVPTNHVEDGLPLGQWCWDIRRRKLTGRLHPSLEDEIWAGTPSRWITAGPRYRWQWDKPDTQWRLAYAALQQYVAREGHSTPATSHKEQLPDARVNLGQWVSLQRHMHHKDELDAARTAALERMPGWRWTGDIGGTREFEPPIDLPDNLDHGGAGAIARGCKCDTCLTARRAREREWLVRKRQERGDAGVDPGPAARHLAKLERGITQRLARDYNDRIRPGAGRTLVVAASSVPLGVLRQVAAGTSYGISREHDALIRGTTVDACLSHVRFDGSRGRRRIATEERIDAAPTWALIEDLGSRGFTRGWIGRELGYTNGLQLDPYKVTRRIAKQVQLLHQRVGDLVLPPGPLNRRAPSLVELLKGQVA